jgi:hypothetical protein
MYQLARIHVSSFSSPFPPRLTPSIISAGGRLYVIGVRDYTLSFRNCSSSMDPARIPLFSFFACLAIWLSGIFFHIFSRRAWTEPFSILFRRNFTPRRRTHRLGRPVGSSSVGIAGNPPSCNRAQAHTFLVTATLTATHCHHPAAGCRPALNRG